MKVSLRRIRDARTFETLNQIFKDIERDVAESGDEVFISDLMINWETGGDVLLERLRQDKRKKYYLKVIKDIWGQPVKPGDKVRREFKEKLHRAPGTPIHHKILTASVRSGNWEKDFLRFEDFVIDEKGCIKCSAGDMWYFLSHFGIHCYSREPISFHVNETSAGPQKVQSDGSMKHRHYWLYEEVETKKYDELPLLTVEKKDFSEKKR